MSRKIEMPDGYDLAGRYKAGATQHEIASECGVSQTVVRRWFREAGIQPRAAHARRTACDATSVIRMYREGAGIPSISSKHGVPTSTVISVLDEHGIRRRGRSDAERLKWGRIKEGGPDAIRAQCSAAWEATRGRTVTQKEKIRRALGFAGVMRAACGKLERDLSVLMAARGFPPSWQHAIGPYNVDLALDEGRIAVEVMRFKPTPSRKCHSLTRERVEYILNQGWCLLAVMCPPKRRPGVVIERFDGAAVADHVIALAERSSRGPSLAGQYGMVDGYAQPTSVASLDLDGLPAIRST